jgi:uncharacterized DUF497 family protein
VEFEWDDVKARSNLTKHGVAFEDATYLWDDPAYQLRSAKTVGGEER